MKINQLHDWHLSIDEAKRLQGELANQISRKNEITKPLLIAGSDISGVNTNGTARATVVVLEYPSLEIREVQTTEDKPTFPYIPGLLSFRESPLLLSVFNKLTNVPDLILVDGQGIAHPRRFGIASHLGLILDTPTIGCAKSKLCGSYKPLSNRKAGIFTELMDHDEVIGAVVITKEHTSPVYVSIGHKVDLSAAILWVMKCCKGYRLPEPCRLAHLAASGKYIDLTLSADINK
jgi:deoxyribonuclease V